MSDDKSTVDWRNDIRDQLLAIAEVPRYEGGHPRVSDIADESSSKRAFLGRAFEEIAEALAKNHVRASGSGTYANPDPENYEAVYEVLDFGNVHDIDVRANGWHSPSVRVWLSDCPTWANHADRVEFNFSANREHYNGDPAHAVIDVRPY